MRGDFPETVPYGYCHCGCGQKTKIATRTDRRWNSTKGEPRKCIWGHTAKPLFGKDNPNWKGGRIKKCKLTSYRQIHMPDHPRSHTDGYVFEHILVAEKVLGKPLLKGTQIHHIDGDGLNNNNNNLVACQDQAYHSLLHKRQRRLKNGV